MHRALAPVLVLVLLAGAWPATPASAQEDEACIGAPELHPDYEWEYIDQDGVHRFEEVIRTGPSVTRYGQWNVTTYEVTEIQDGQTLVTGRLYRFNDDGPHPMGLMQVDRRLHTEDDGQRVVDAWDPPLQIVHDGAQTCHLSRWTHETRHVHARGGDPPASAHRDEAWQAKTLGWENVTVTAGTFEAMHVRAVREQDLYTVDTWWSPEVRHAVKIERGPRSGPPTETLELAWYILDQRPTARFSVMPADPHAGDDLELDASPSYDPDGNITGYRWLITTPEDRFETTGPTATIPDVPAGTVRVQLYVTDDVNRTSRRTGTFYMPEPGGTGIAVDGPLAAEPGQIVRLETLTPFDPWSVRWRIDDRIVGDGQVYSFRMAENVTLHVSALHPSGRTYTTNHTVQRLPPGTLDRTGDASPDGRSAGQARGAVDGWPVGGSSVLALLDPLEGQVVEPNLTAELWTSGPANLTVDGQPVWSGTGPQATVDLSLEPGRHTLLLTSEAGRHEVNVTVRGDTLGTPTGGDGGPAGQDPVGLPGAPATLLALLGAAAVLASRTLPPGRLSPARTRRGR